MYRAGEHLSGKTIRLKGAKSDGFLAAVGGNG
jgi:hypothetical protein